MNACRISKYLALAIFAAAGISPLSGHGGPGPEIAVEILKGFFPEAQDFERRHTELSPQAVSRIEQLSGIPLRESDRDLTLYVALVKDAQTGKPRSVGAVLALDAEGEQGIIDVLVAYKPDGTVKKVRILNNRESKELESAAFLRQLEGKGPAEKWDLQKGFVLVGSSASAREIIRAVYRGMHLFLAFPRE
jgi:hypothetical protein